VRPTRRERGADLVYLFTDRGKQEELPQDKVLHTRGWGFGGDLGLSPLAFARETLGGALATEEAAARVYGTGLRATGIFTAPVDMNETQRKQFHENYIKKMEGPEGEGRQIVLPPGFSHQAINITPKDAEMLLSRRFNVEDICRFMGTPPILVGHAAEGQTMWGSGVENIILSWLTLGLDAFMTMIERSVTKRLLAAPERQRFYAEFDRNALLRADTAARAEFIAKMVQFAQMTPNEGRKKDNRPPMPGGDQLFVNSTMVPLEMAGQRTSRVQPAPGEPIPE
jgi:HK97 family phage portal protein